jgi:hypothetical protein
MPHFHSFQKTRRAPRFGRFGITVTLLGTLLSAAQFSGACTIFNATQGNTTLVGDNEDDAYTKHRIWIIPPTTGKNGRVYFTTDLATVSNYIVGGMNQHGLFFDATLYGDRGITLDPKKQTPDWGVVQQLITEQCATVNEAVAMYDVYNERSFQNAQFMWIDSTGASAVAGWDYVNNKVAVTRKSGSSQVIANFNIACDVPDPVNDWRYFTAKRILDRTIDNMSVKLFSQILDSVKSQTLYSIVANLRTKDIYFSNTWTSGGFSTSCTKFNLANQFTFGERIFDCDTLRYYSPGIFLPPAFMMYAPAQNAVSVPPGATIGVLFDKKVYSNSGLISIVRQSDKTIFETIPVPSAMVTGSGTNTIVINPAIDFDQGTKYSVLMDENCFVDTFGNSCEGISSLTQWSFTTAGTAQVIGRSDVNTTHRSLEIQGPKATVGNGVTFAFWAEIPGLYSLSVYNLQGRLLSAKSMRTAAAGIFTCVFSLNDIYHSFRNNLCVVVLRNENGPASGMATILTRGMVH